MDRDRRSRRVRIAGRGKHDAQRRTPIPFGFDLVERAIDAVLEQREQVGLQAHEDRLRLRIAEAAVEFQTFDAAVRSDHETRVQESRIGCAVALACPATAGWITSRMMRACSVGVTTCAGE